MEEKITKKRSQTYFEIEYALRFLEHFEMNNRKREKKNKSKEVRYVCMFSLMNSCMTTKENSVENIFKNHCLQKEEIFDVWNESPFRIMENKNDINETNQNVFVAGDILLFAAYPEMTREQKYVYYSQKIPGYKEGHIDTVHTAIYIGNNKIAHIIQGDDYNDRDCKSFAYFQHNLSEMLRADQCIRAIQAFRPKNKEFARLIFENAKKPIQGSLRWNLSKAIASVFLPIKFTASYIQKKEDVSFSSKIICSEFVAEVINISIVGNDEYCNHFHTKITPRGLEQILLRSNRHFHHFWTEGLDRPLKPYSPLAFAIFEIYKQDEKSGHDIFLNLSQKNKNELLKEFFRNQDAFREHYKNDINIQEIFRFLLNNLTHINEK